MNVVSFVILMVVLLLLGVAIRSILRNREKSCGCSGAGSCAGACCHGCICSATDHPDIDCSVIDRSVTDRPDSKCFAGGSSVSTSGVEKKS